MILFTQDRLSSIWKRLADGSECDDYDRIDVGDGIDAWIAPHMDLEQTLGLSKQPSTYSDSSDDNGYAFYTRTQLAKGTLWGLWR
jgi:hypothetical protein